MTEYQFVKDSINLTKLQEEIQTAINTSVNYSVFSEPDVLKIYFDEDLTVEQQDIISSVISSHNASEEQTAEKKFLVKEFSAQNRLVKETWYAIDNGDGTYSNKIEETVYEWSKNDMIGRSFKKFWLDGSETTEEIWKYFKNGKNIIEKRIK